MVGAGIGMDHNHFGVFRRQRQAWRHWFDHFVFGDEAPGAAAHLPPHAQGVTGPPSPERDEMIRQFLLKVLGAP